MFSLKKFNLKGFSILTILFLLLSHLIVAQSIVLPNGHSHNDYKQKHPLTDALNSGFTSIEADVFLIRGKLIVSHIRPFFNTSKTLDALYLKPLYDSISKHHGNVFINYKQPIILLIDIKTNASKTYSALKQLLEKYKSVLTIYENGIITNGAITIVLTGNKPYDNIKNENKRFAFIDDNLLNLNTENKTAIFLMASTKYSNLMKWKGRGVIPKEQKQKLIDLVNLAHQQGKKVRLWASPENTVVWEELLNCGVDFINTDELVKFKQFLTQPTKEVK